MSRPRFLADHDFNQKVIDGVWRKQPVVEFVRLLDVGLAQAADPAILEFAASQGLVVVSHDVNTMCGYAYARIEHNLSMSGLFVITQDKPIGPVIEELLLIWDLTEAEDWIGRVTFLPLPRTL